MRLQGRVFNSSESSEIHQFCPEINNSSEINNSFAQSPIQAPCNMMCMTLFSEVEMRDIMFYSSEINVPE